MFTVSIVTSVILKRLLGLGPKVAEIFTYLPLLDEYNTFTSRKWCINNMLWFVLSLPSNHMSIQVGGLSCFIFTLLKRGGGMDISINIMETH